LLLCQADAILILHSHIATSSHHLQNAITLPILPGIPIGCAESTPILMSSIEMLI